MAVSAGLTSQLQGLVLRLEDDLRARVADLPDISTRWHAEYESALKRERTAAAWEAWRDDRVTLAAVGWVITCVFVRFCEDNGLVRPVWIAGPEPRRQEALDAQLDYFRAHPEHTDREWLQQAFGYLESLPATRGLVDEHAAWRLVTPSGDAAAMLLAFFRDSGEDGRILRDFTDPTMSTRFLGDLYQDLSVAARERYALLQTPEFVEEFILDRTLEPALAERPLEGFRLIDPACGSGHFLLGAFARLLDRWERSAPGMETQARVQAALDAIHGVDLNPYAVAIARFRLTVAALQACGLRLLESAPAFRFHLVAGDSLLHGHQQLGFELGAEYDGDSALSGFCYSTEDLQQLRQILTPGRYDVVVGNPPYITVKDKALNRAYRARYQTCKGTYALTVPFMERFFELARGGDCPGWIGQITSNSFMKREFGSKLIEDFLARKDLRLVVDTSGAYIPGHGTPTVILVGRNAQPVAPTVRAVLGVRGEPGRPANPAKGVVWRSILEHVDTVGWESEWISVTCLDRTSLTRHPWNLTGGGAIELEKRIGGSRHVLADHISGKIGFASFPGADDAFFAPRQALLRTRVPPRLQRAVVTGDVVRDYSTHSREWALVPYDEDSNLVAIEDLGVAVQRQWPMRTVLRGIIGFEGETRGDTGAPWWAWYRWVPARYRTPQSIAYAEVATHNHFVFDHGGKVFKQTAPVIKLPEDATEEDHLALLGLLNSSTGCFWLKQVCHNKGSTVDQAGARQTLDAWENFFQFNATNVAEFPVPAERIQERPRLLNQLSQKLATFSPAAVCEREPPTFEALDVAHSSYESTRRRMIAIQEELDWEVYRLYGLVSDDLTYHGDDLPGLALGERAFEIALARRVAAGEEETTWFTRHGSTPITEIPTRWPMAYRELVQRRLDLIETDRHLRLLERPEHKRRWAAVPWDQQVDQALREWLLDRLEQERLWFDAQGRPTPRSVTQLADEAARDPEFVSVLALWEGRPDVPVVASLQRLLAEESVPFLAAYRYKESGLRKRSAWEHTWQLQRAEDRGEQVGPIPVPPKYVNTDFVKQSYWQARGKLDVPKERFISYPDANRGTDPTPLLGWAGWDHAQQALALATIIGAREAEGWGDERLVPLVAGLAELQPWVEQWHADVHPTYGVSLAAFTREQLTARAAQVGKTIDQLRAWRPQPLRRGRKARARA